MAAPGFSVLRAALAVAALSGLFGAPHAAMAQTRAAGPARTCSGVPVPKYLRATVADCGHYLDPDPYLRFGSEWTQSDPHGGHFDYERLEAARMLPRPPRDPDEIAAIALRVYGTRSLLTQGARSVAQLSNSAQAHSQVALSGLNSAAHWAVEGARRAFHRPGLPEIRLRSKLRSRYVGLGLHARW